MVEFRRMKEEDLEKVSNFLSELNNIEESHISYCGKESESIAGYLKEDLEVPYTECFILSFEQKKLIGVLGFDCDFETHTAEIWGPFIKEDYWDTSLNMWNKMVDLMPSVINELIMLPNKQNSRVHKLAYELGFKKTSEESILECQRHKKRNLNYTSIVELSQEYFSEFKQLHDKAFPRAYYSGQTIINRINDQRKVFIITNDNHELSGYIYVEVDPEFGDAGIEFFAVQESERGRGIGGLLITAGLDWLCSFENIESVILCVNSGNDGAINLYKKVGFQHIHDLFSFTKNLN